MSAAFFTKVLLVEDDESHAFLIKRALKDCAAQIQHCSSFSQALIAVNDFDGDLVISDLNLPDSRGTDHIRRLRDARGDLPIIVLTSSTALEDAVEAMKQGARDFLVKNFDRDFKEILQFALSRLYTALELERDRSRIQREMEVLRVAIENSSDAMAVFNSKGQINYCNKSFREFASACAGTCDSIFSTLGEKVERREELLRNLGNAFEKLASGGVWKSEVNLIDAVKSFDMSLSAIAGDADRSAVNYVLWVRDITEAKRRENFQREIISTTTHDLKGPLGAILISCELLEPLLEKKSKAAELVVRIASSAQGSLNLIDEFLSARRMEEGTFILKPIEYDVVSLVTEAISDFQSIATSRSISLEIESKADRLEAKVDKLGLGRVVGNLVSNSLKFTPKGGRILLRIVDDGGLYRISVEDTGSGMEPSEIQTIFNRFARLEKHSLIKGTGIGLYVVKNIIAAHGGRIEVTSRVGEGTRFELILPKEPPVNSRGELITLDFR